MQKTTTSLSLKQSILVLERLQVEQANQLKEQFVITYESLKPLAVLRKALQEITNPSDFKDNVIQTATGVITGFLSRRILVRSSRNPLIRLAGLFVQHQISNFVASHADTIIALVKYSIWKLSGVLKKVPEITNKPT